MKTIFALPLIVSVASIVTTLSAQIAYHFDTGGADGQLATDISGIRAETADDFVLSDTTQLTSATFDGLLPKNSSIADISQIGIAIYRVFPNDSTFPPSGAVPTRLNSPADVALLKRDSTMGSLSYSGAILAPDFVASNSVTNGIFSLPNTLTGGEGSVEGAEAEIDLTFDTSITLVAGHYFFAPTVTLTDGDFYWLSAARPIGSSGTPFIVDLESQIRNETLSPDWLRVGTDIIGEGKTYNAAFSLDGMTNAGGSAVPEPSTYGLVAAGALIALIARKRSRHTSSLVFNSAKRGR